MLLAHLMSVDLMNHKGEQGSKKDVQTWDSMRYLQKIAITTAEKIRQEQIWSKDKTDQKQPQQYREKIKSGDEGKESERQRAKQ